MRVYISINASEVVDQITESGDNASLGSASAPCIVAFGCPDFSSLLHEVIIEMVHHDPQLLRNIDGEASRDGPVWTVGSISSHSNTSNANGNETFVGKSLSTIRWSARLKSTRDIISNCGLLPNVLSDITEKKFKSDGISMVMNIASNLDWKFYLTLK